jgi:hypothetical protein
MVKLQFNKKQYTLTLSSDLVKRMGWKQGAELFISKDPNSDMLYIEEIKSESASNLQNQVHGRSGQEK